jgi:hypothetical protein
MKLQLLPASLACALVAYFSGVGCTDDPARENDASVVDVRAEDASPDGVEEELDSIDSPQPDASSDSGDDTNDGASQDDGATNVDPGIPANTGAPDIDMETLSGFQILELTYAEPRLGDDRTIDVHIWYPSTDQAGEPATFKPQLPLFSDEFAFTDATILPPPEGQLAPMVLYSHGGRGFSGQISAVARQFVRNGWIVVAPSHPGQNLFDFEENLPYSYAIIRAADTIAALNLMENLPEDHPLRGRVDTSRILAMGHSYGGQNSWMLGGLPFDLEGIAERCSGGCTSEDVAAYTAFRSEPRVVAGISVDNLLDENLFRDEDFEDMQTPMLHISSTEGNDGTSIFNRAAPTNTTWVSLLGGCHESVTGTRECPTLDLTVSQPAAAAYSIAFGARHVLGSEDPTVLGILDGSIEVSDKVSLQLSPGAR